MSTNYTIELPHDCEARISVTFGPYGSRADGTVFDVNADIVAETDSPPMFVDYCHAEILAMTIGDMLPVFEDDAAEYVAIAGIECDCED